MDDSASMKPTAAPTAPAGLAGLDFELPTDKDLYDLRFTTPQGEPELTARTITNTALGRLEFLAGIAAASLLVWVAFWLIARGALGLVPPAPGGHVAGGDRVVVAVRRPAAVAGLIAFVAGVCLLVAHSGRGGGTVVEGGWQVIGPKAQ